MEPFFCQCQPHQSDSKKVDAAKTGSARGNVSGRRKGYLAVGESQEPRSSFVRRECAARQLKEHQEAFHQLLRQLGEAHDREVAGLQRLLGDHTCVWAAGEQRDFDFNREIVNREIVLPLCEGNKYDEISSHISTKGPATPCLDGPITPGPITPGPITPATEGKDEEPKLLHGGTSTSVGGRKGRNNIDSLHADVGSERSAKVSSWRQVLESGQGFPFHRSRTQKERENKLLSKISPVAANTPPAPQDLVGGLRSRMQRGFKQERRNEILMSFIILVHLVYTVWRNYATVDPLITKLASAFFVVVFFWDIARRAWLDRMEFLCGRGRWANLRDTLVLIAVAADYWWFTSNWALLLSTTRWVKCLLFFRVVSQTSTFAEMRLIVNSMLAAARTAWWAWCLAGGAVLLLVGTVASSDTKSLCEEAEMALRICRYLDDPFHTVAYMYMAVFGGVDWADVFEAVAPSGHVEKYGVLALLTFIGVGFRNVVAAAIVAVVIDKQRNDVNEAISRELALQTENIHKLSAIFDEMDIDESGEVTIDELELACLDRRMYALMKAMQLNVYDIKSLFFLLDDEGRGAVSLVDFIVGCTRLKGAATAIDMVVLQHKTDQILRSLQAPISTLDRDWPGGPPMQKMDSIETSKSFATHVAGHVAGRELAWGGQYIAHVEQRSMALSELKMVRQLVQRHCHVEQWRDSRTGQILARDKVDLHAFNFNYTMPRTAPDGIVVSGLRTKNIKQGQSVAQADNVTSVNQAEGIVSRVESGKVHIEVKRGKFRTDLPMQVDGQDVGQPSGINVPVSISFKELVCTTPKQPLWYCSHSWSHPVLDFIDLCETHATNRGLDETAGYWVCGYALRQNNLEEELSKDIAHSSFLKAMRPACGVLLLVDRDAAVFSRIWCSLELYVNITDCRKSLDIVTSRADGASKTGCLLCEDLLPGEKPGDRAFREKRFPVDTLEKGLHIKLEDAKATVPEDKRAILQYFEATKQATGNGITEANAALRGLFARAIWAPAMRGDGLGSMLLHLAEGDVPPGFVSLPATLAADLGRTRLDLNLSNMAEVNLKSVSALAQGLPPKLLDLDLRFTGCSYFDDRCLRTLAEKLPTGLTRLSLVLLGCKKITDAGVEALAENLPQGLTDLTLHLDNCQAITEQGVMALACNLPRTTRSFNGTFFGTQVDRNFDTVKQLRALMTTSGNTMYGKRMFFDRVNATPS